MMTNTVDKGTAQQSRKDVSSAVYLREVPGLRFRIQRSGHQSMDSVPLFPDQASRVGIGDVKSTSAERRSMGRNIQIGSSNED